MADLVFSGVTISGGWTITAEPPASDPYFSYTTMLLPGNGTNNAQNNTFLDSSTNNFTVTRAGNATQGTANPFGSEWSTYFNGNGNYIEAPSSSAFDFGTSDFTIECWVNLAWFSSSGTSSKISTLVFGAGSNADGGGSTRYDFDVNYQGYLVFQNAPEGGANNFSVSATNNPLSLNTWTHVAVTRVGTAINLFVNGTKCTVSGTIGAGQAVNRSSVLRIGRLFTSGTYDFQTKGYISNLRITNGTALYTATFTPATAPLAPVANTRLLTCQSAAMVDNASNFSMSIPGGVTGSRFAPFGNYAVTPTNYSGYFDGSGDYLTIAENAAFRFGTGDFTVECWFNTSSTTGQYSKRLIDHYTYNAADYGWSLGVLRTGGATLTFSGSTSGTNYVNLTSSTTVTPGTWHHLAVARSGSTASMFFDGTRVATQTGITWNDTNTISTGLTIAAQEAAAGGTVYDGCLSNIRIVKGTAVYNPTSTTLTVPTSPLTAISGTSILTCQSTTFIDNSTNAFAITVNGNSTPKQTNPFGFTTSSSLSSWSTSGFGGSAYFDGSGDYLDVASNAAFGYGTGDFTIEFWAYFTSISASTPNLFDQRAATNPQVVPTLYLNNGVLSYYVNGANRWTGSTLATNTWFHIAVSRSSGTTKFFVNGAQDGASYADSNNYITSPVRIFASNDGGAAVAQAGYCNNFRIVKGTAVYTGPFVPPTAPLTAIANTQLLLSATNGAIVDYTMTADLETAGDAKISTAQSKFGGSSMYFDGTGDYLVTPSSPRFIFGTGAFTIEFWFYAATSQTSSRTVFISNNLGSFTTNFWGVQLNNASPSISNKLQLWAYNLNSSSVALQGATTLTANTWYYVALVRSGNTFTFYLNGVSDGTTTNAASLDGGGSNSIAIAKSITDYYAGYISDLRITPGIARYTTNFTPPSQALPTY